MVLPQRSYNEADGEHMRLSNMPINFNAQYLTSTLKLNVQSDTTHDAYITTRSTRYQHMEEACVDAPT